MSKDKRTDWTVLGRKIGTATGWDEPDTFVMVIYDFEPADGIDLPSGDVNFNFETGTAETYDDDGEVTMSMDLVEVLAGHPVGMVIA